MNKVRLVNLIGGSILTGGSFAVARLCDKGIIRPKTHNGDIALAIGLGAAEGCGLHMLFDAAIDVKYFPEGPAKDRVGYSPDSKKVCLKTTNCKTGCSLVTYYDPETATAVGNDLIEAAKEVLKAAE